MQSRDFGVIALVALCIIVVVPLSFYYLGTMGNVNFSEMATDLVFVGVFLTVLFVAVLVVKSHMGR